MSDPFAGLPRNHFGAILADPPWSFYVWSDSDKSHGSAASHYKTMDVENIKLLPVAELATDNCALFIWVCWPNLIESINVIKAWGFNYKTCAFSWIKANGSQIDMFKEDIKTYMGLGYWTRANSEVCLLGTKGKPKRLSMDVRQAIIEPRREHSRKPDCVQRRIERLVAGPYLELFARRSRHGWTTWGNEATKFDSVPA